MPNPKTKDIDDAVQRLCLRLPEAEEYTSHGSPNYRVRGKTFATYTINHHGDGRIALLVNRSVPDQTALIENEPSHFFVPPFVGHRGWEGIHLNQGLAWSRINHELEAGYMRVAPKALAVAIEPFGDFTEPAYVPTADDLNPYLKGRPKETLEGLREILYGFPGSGRRSAVGASRIQSGQERLLYDVRGRNDHALILGRSRNAGDPHVRQALFHPALHRPQRMDLVER